MKLRSQIILFLFLFALIPLMAVVIINFPMVLDRMEGFYRQAHLQNLRADFRDLDQHLASRHDTVRLLAKLPEAPLLTGRPAGDGLQPHASALPNERTDALRRRFTFWINQVLTDQPDIVQVLFVDPEGNAGYGLDRNPETWSLDPNPPLADRPRADFIAQGLQLNFGGVHTSPLSIAGPADDERRPGRLMTLRLISPIFQRPSPAEAAPRLAGAVVLTIDVGGLARTHKENLWVLDDGTYLPLPGARRQPGAAFADFPGLEALFAAKDLTLWQGEDRDQVLWVPMLPVEDGAPLWVGRRVDPSPIAEFRDALRIRVFFIVLALALLVWLLAIWFAHKADRFRGALTQGIDRILHDEAVRFELSGPQEVKELAENLTTLSKKHAVRNQALREHARELETSNRYKSEFLANVSHELRTPLNSILLLSKLLADDGGRRLSKEQLQQSRVIHEAGSDLKTLIDNILDLSRIEAGRNVLHTELVDLPAMLEGLVELVAPQFQDKGLTLDLDIHPDAPAHIQTDGDKLRQIIKNFLSNAVKFTAQGGARIQLRPTTGPHAGKRPICIAVTDSGIGIPEDQHAVIFEAFQQADGATNRRYGGTGLGLSISRELARLMGGRIQLESRENQGSTFSLLLPPAVQRQETQGRKTTDTPANPDKSGGTKTKTAAAPALPTADFRGRRILVVDDDLRNLLSITPLLEGWSLNVTGAGDGAEALEALAEEDPFDLVLMDIMMPGLDGLETMRRLRARERGGAPPVIALSAKAAPEDKAQCLEAGADDFLAKPVDPADLLRALQRVLGNHEQNP